jgi:hypothetical protein
MAMSLLVAKIIFEPEVVIVHKCVDELHDLEKKRYQESQDYLVKDTIAECSCGKRWRLAFVPPGAKDSYSTFLIASNLSWIPDRGKR